jgi:hypothetical protein
VILAIDPGNTESAYVVVDENLKPLKFGISKNEDLLGMVYEDCFFEGVTERQAAIEMIAHYGKDMSAGKEVFETCVWIGRFLEALSNYCSTEKVYRKDEKIHICGSMKAKDTNIRRALIDRFAQHDLKNGKGTVKKPDWFYGFKDDIWQAYAVAITYAERREGA